jgi:hypothetical protein
MVYRAIEAPVPAEAGAPATVVTSVPLPTPPDANVDGPLARETIRLTYPVDEPRTEVGPGRAEPEALAPPTAPDAASAAGTVVEARRTDAPVDTIPADAAAAGLRPPDAALGAAAAVPLPSPVATTLAPSAVIEGVLRGYEDAYDRRDVDAAALLWPSLDRRALTRAFASLDRQDVEFERCDIAVDGARGSAVCLGTLRYVPTVGSGGERTGRITWTFDLARTGEAWRIAGLRAR